MIHLVCLNLNKESIYIHNICVCTYINVHGYFFPVAPFSLSTMGLSQWPNGSHEIEIHFKIKA